MKANQRPKYRMIHACNHEHGCVLMADNMASRSDELFIEIQQQGQMSLFEQSAENEVVFEDDIRKKMQHFVQQFSQGLTADKLIAAFYTEYGVLCKTGVIKQVWRDMEQTKEITVMRTPFYTDKGNPSLTFTESKKQTVLIKGCNP